MQKSLFRHLYTWVLLAILLGGALGYGAPGIGTELKPLGDAFIKLIRMVVTPIIFTTVVVGIAGMGSFKRVGRVGLKAIMYFEIVTTLALVIGWCAVKWIQPGTGVNADPATLDTKAITNYVTQAKGHGLADFFLSTSPSSIVDAFARGDIVQVLFFSVLFGFAASPWASEASRSLDCWDSSAVGVPVFGSFCQRGRKNRWRLCPPPPRSNLRNTGNNGISVSAPTRCSGGKLPFQVRRESATFTPRGV